MQLLGDFLKTEVFELARYLKIPRAIIKRPPSGGLWPGQVDEEEMGVTYQQLDRYLQSGEGEPEVVEIIEKMIAKGAHKREMPPVAVVPRY